MAFDRETSLAILNEARAGGYEDQPIPEDEEALSERANYFYVEAKKIFEDGVNDQYIGTIIFLGDTAMLSAENSDLGRGIKSPAVEETYPRRSSGGLSESDERETENVDVHEHKAGFDPDWNMEETGTPGFKLMVDEHLPIPQHIEGDPDPMPRDLSSLTDKEVRRLSGEYNAYLARTTYLLGVESSDLANSEHILENERARTLRGLNLVDPNGDGKKQKLAKVIDAEILADPKVGEWEAAVAKHQQVVIVLKSLKEIYSSNVDRLSREWTMRQNEWEKSR